MSVTVSFTPNTENRNVDHYRAVIEYPSKELECTVPATSGTELECHILGLNETTEYTVIGTACLKDNKGCSSGVEGKAKTYKRRECIDCFDHNKSSYPNSKFQNSSLKRRLP